MNKFFHIFFHKWLPWSDPIATFESGRKQQWRICSICNKADHRTLFWDHQSNIKDIMPAIDKTKQALSQTGEG